MDSTEDSKPAAKGNSRLTWVPIKRTTADPDQPSYPFLFPDSHKDLYFIRVLLCVRPFVAPHGSITQLWDKTAEMLSEQRDPHGNLIFVKKVNRKAVQSCFKDYMIFIKEY